ncbi:WxL domain-containing protein [Vagococcus silagei]|uniref:WxL domain-containing protein n=1 Tax=Vagococcus silagei TaxID=2508885 RepID=A0A4V3TVB7_9ENTE|nr:WxL domain-containing protein [Vagococcus silagei]THB62289.1 hypothetical protein ESZ54_00295 [Vagococcus silagei]
MTKQLLKVIRVSSLLMFLAVSFPQLSNAAPTDSNSKFSAGDRPKSDFPNETLAELEYLESETNQLPSLDNLYITHIPSMAFGGLKIAKEDQEYPALMEKRTKTSSNETYALPHMVGVADLNGKKEGTWKVSVHQEKPFFSQDAGKYLYYSRIRIYGNTVTNSGMPSNQLGSNLTGVKNNQTGGFVQIPVLQPMLSKIPSEGEMDVLKSGTPGFTNKTYSNSIMQSNYQRASYQPNQAIQSSKNEDVKLYISNKDVRLAKNYEANLVWTLTAEP